MADKGLELLSTLLQTVGAASQGVSRNEDGSKNYALFPMLAGAAGQASSLQDQKLDREAKQFQLQKEKEAWQIAKEDRQRQLSQEEAQIAEQAAIKKQQALEQQSLTGVKQVMPKPIAEQVKTPQGTFLTPESKKEYDAYQESLKTAGQAVPKEDLAYEKQVEAGALGKAKIAGAKALESFGIINHDAVISITNKYTKQKKEFSAIVKDGKVDWLSAPSDITDDLAIQALDPASPFHAYKDEIKAASIKKKQYELETKLQNNQRLQEAEDAGIITPDQKQMAMQNMETIVNQAGPQMRFEDIYNKNMEKIKMDPLLASVPDIARAKMAFAATQAFTEMFLAKWNDPNINQKARYSNPEDIKVQQTKLIDTKTIAQNRRVSKKKDSKK